MIKKIKRTFVIIKSKNHTQETYRTYTKLFFMKYNNRYIGVFMIILKYIVYSVFGVQLSICNVR